MIVNPSSLGFSIPVFTRWLSGVVSLPGPTFVCVYICTVGKLKENKMV